MNLYINIGCRKRLHHFHWCSISDAMAFFKHLPFNGIQFVCQYLLPAKFAKVMFLHVSVICPRGGRGWGVVVSQHALQVSRPTPKGEVEGSGQGEGVSRPTWGVSRPTPGGGACPGGSAPGGACSGGVPAPGGGCAGGTYPTVSNCFVNLG